MAERLTSEERALVRGMVHALYERFELREGEKRSWAAFARKAAVSEYSLAEWRRGDGAPSALNFLRLLRAAGVLDDDYAIPPARRRVSGRAAGDEATAEVLRELRKTTALLQRVTEQLGSLQVRLGAASASTCRRSARDGDRRAARGELIGESRSQS